MIENWTPPDGLGYSSLRPVQLTGAGIALLVVAGAMLLGAVAAGIGLGATARAGVLLQSALRFACCTTPKTRAAMRPIRSAWSR